MKRIIVLGFLGSIGHFSYASLPPGFCNLKDSIPSINLEIRYAGCDNFVGRSLVGYESPQAILSLKAASALKKVELQLNQQGLGLKVFDAYRPQKTVDYFAIWAADTRDTLTKWKYYPKIAKEDLHRLGYIANRSGHSRGSTVDVTLIDLSSQQELDMGSIFDYFDDISHFDSPIITEQQKANRIILQEMMQRFGFKPIDEEWWHFTLENEPFSTTYFDF